MDATARVSRLARTLLAITALALATGVTAGRAQTQGGDTATDLAARTQVLVTFRPGTSPAAQSALLARVGLVATARIGGVRAVVARAHPGARDRALALLRRSPLVATAQPDRVVKAALTPNDTFFADLSWPAVGANLPAAWEATLGDPSVTIAVIDTGVNPVADLAGALVPGYDFIHNGTDTTDDNGHGTEVASIAAARTNNGLGIAGVCGRCSIMPVKVLDASGSGLSSTVAQGVSWAAAHGARIINLSATTPSDDPVLDAAIASATAGGAVVVLAAGNAGSTDPAKGGYPAASSPNAIRVAGVDQSGALFPWSNHGSWVDVAAPGSAEAATSNGQYFLGLQGTSVAAPFVSGIAGLLLSRDSSLQPAAVKSLITANGQPVDGLDVSSGRRVDAYASLLAAGYTPPPVTPPAPTTDVAQPSPAPADQASASATRLPATPPKAAVVKRTPAAEKKPQRSAGCTATGRTGTTAGSGQKSSRSKPSCRGR